MEDPTGKLRLYKCKGMAGLYAAPRMQALKASSDGPQPYVPPVNADGCDCGPLGFKAEAPKRTLVTKKSQFPC